MKYFKKAIEFGHLKGGNGIGEVYYFGVNKEPINRKEGAKWFKMMTDKGFCLSCYHYGWMLYFGNGVPVNKKDIAKYLQKMTDAEFYHKKATGLYAQLLYEDK